VVAAAPVIARTTAQALRARNYQVVSIMEPDPFFAVRVYYTHFAPVSENTVRRGPSTSARAVSS
jgi:predicted phosphoribosyltransferase